MPQGPVLVVDDEPHIRELVRLYLEKEGFRVTEAGDGEAALQAVRETQPEMVILEMGADDYLTKPFHPRELVARVRAVLRRARPAAAEHPRLDFPDFALDYGARSLTVQGQPVLCPPKEFELLWTLASHPERVFTREQLLQLVWDYDYFGDLRTVDVHVQRLRKKIEPSPDQPHYLKTVWGVGYKFESGSGHD